jgi:hypothetical protein
VEKTMYHSLDVDEGPGYACFLDAFSFLVSNTSLGGGGGFTTTEMVQCLFVASAWQYICSITNTPVSSYLRLG